MDGERGHIFGVFLLRSRYRSYAMSYVHSWLNKENSVTQYEYHDQYL